MVVVVGAGCLIPDSEYSPGFDNKELGGSAVRVYGLLNSVSNYFKNKGYDLSFVKQLQSCHDAASHEEPFVGVFQMNMQSLAVRFNLNVPRK